MKIKNKNIVFTYTGHTQIFIPNTPKIHVVAFGASGGDGNLGGGVPGKGGMISATLKVKPGVPLYINIGGKSNKEPGCGTKFGGEASDIRFIKNDLHSRILVAGGGGSVGGYNGGIYGTDPHPFGGKGGGIKGGKSSGKGGSQKNGGLGYVYSKECIGENGIFGFGGSGNNICGCNGSGGDGWYGGAGGTNEGGGGGGSSYAIPGSTDIIHLQGVNDGDGFMSILY